MKCRSCLGTRVNGLAGSALLRSIGFRSCSCLSLTGSPAEGVLPSKILQRALVGGWGDDHTGRRWSYKQEPSLSPLPPTTRMTLKGRSRHR